MFKKFFDISISGILLTIGLGMYLTALIVLGLPSVSVFCFFSSVLCFGMAFYLMASTTQEEREDTGINTACVITLLTISVTLLMIGAEVRSSI